MKRNLICGYFLTFTFLPVVGSVPAWAQGAQDSSRKDNIAEETQNSVQTVSFGGERQDSIRTDNNAEERGDDGFVAERQDSIRTENLGEITVKAELVKRAPDGDEYIIVAPMRERGVTALELLGQVPGVQLNRLTNKLQINNKSNILLLVNGRPQSYDYVSTLPPETIKRVKVVQHPKGRFSSEGYDAVIELTVRKEEGWDVNLSNMTLTSPLKNNGDDLLMMEQPAVNLAYTHDKISVYGMFCYGKSNWNTPRETTLSYRQAAGDTLTAAVSGTEAYSYNGRVGSAGVNYRLSPTQVLSFDYDYLHEDDNMDNRMAGKDMDYLQTDNTCRLE